MIFCIEGQAKAGLKLGEMVPDSKLSKNVCQKYDSMWAKM